MLGAMLGILTSMIISLPSNIFSDPQPELLSAHATAYCATGVTKSGKYTRDGICAAKQEWLGKTVVVYQRLPDDSVGEIIGIYEILDTGGTPGLKSGKVVDIWCPNLDACQAFMDRVYEDGCQGKVYIQLWDAVG